MRQHRLMPELEAHAPAEPRKLVRQEIRIPGMNTDYAHPVRFTNEEVIAVILRCLHGESHAEIAEEIGVAENTVWAWQDGRLRRLCQMEAERRYREQLRRDAR